jgi:hypothetical protein
MIVSMELTMTHAARRICALAGLLVIALTLAGCDKCGNFFGYPRAEQQACRDTGPAPR